eukprot:CAMPEP_0179217218 /NCGR_PEP_ID=MMETSP0797-20121207/3804_1 /TAXON_ID=47934 /ORGANISM="Dinophysis acuminata, Strain DAEP01" /LENGTH=58 /DNA_ID=CAMNT_0020923447 /DNA_START=111 /DNA_END=284 /DNA_ORIENTATION=+
MHGQEGRRARGNGGGGTGKAGARQQPLAPARAPAAARKAAATRGSGCWHNHRLWPQIS